MIELLNHSFETNEQNDCWALGAFECRKRMNRSLEDLVAGV
jgi:hypothetical protein